jgi:hypothetical protein
MYDLEQFGNALQYAQDVEVSLLSSNLSFYVSNTYTVVTIHLLDKKIPTTTGSQPH